jgi:hypothetical protein
MYSHFLVLYSFLLWFNFVVGFIAIGSVRYHFCDTQGN